MTHTSITPCLGHHLWRLVDGGRICVWCGVDPNTVSGWEILTGEKWVEKAQNTAECVRTGRISDKGSIQGDRGL